jgi:hypothetical protein
MIIKAGYYQPYKLPSTLDLIDRCDVSVPFSFYYMQRGDAGYENYLCSVFSLEFSYGGTDYDGTTRGSISCDITIPGGSGTGMSWNEQSWNLSCRASFDGAPGIFYLPQDIDTDDYSYISSNGNSGAVIFASFFSGLLPVIFDNGSASNGWDPNRPANAHEEREYLTQYSYSVLTFAPYFIAVVNCDYSHSNHLCNNYSTDGYLPTYSSTLGYPVYYRYLDSYPCRPTPASEAVEIEIDGQRLRCVAPNGEEGFQSWTTGIDGIKAANGTVFSMQPLIPVEFYAASYDNPSNFSGDGSAHIAKNAKIDNFSAMYSHPVAECGGYWFTTSEGLWLTDAVLNQLTGDIGNYQPGQTITLYAQQPTSATPKVKPGSYTFGGSNNSIYFGGYGDCHNMSPATHSAYMRALSIPISGYVNHSAQQIATFDNVVVQWYNPDLNAPTYDVIFKSGESNALSLDSYSIYSSSSSDYTIEITSADTYLSTQQETALNAIFTRSNDEPSEPSEPSEPGGSEETRNIVILPEATYTRGNSTDETALAFCNALTPHISGRSLSLSSNAIVHFIIGGVVDGPYYVNKISIEASTVLFHCSDGMTHQYVYTERTAETNTGITLYMPDTDLVAASGSLEAADLWLKFFVAVLGASYVKATIKVSNDTTLLSNAILYTSDEIEDITNYLTTKP